MVPSNVSNRKRAVPDLTPLVTENEGVTFPTVMLKTTPVGEPLTVVPGAGGIVTTSPCFWPAPLYRVDLPVTLSLTQNGLPPERVRPHPFTKSGSVASVTRSVRVYCAKVTAGRPNIESAEAARSFRQLSVSLIIIFFLQIKFSDVKYILCDRHKLRVGWVKVHREQLEFQHERLLSR